jgi:hypothetical protein
MVAKNTNLKKLSFPSKKSGNSSGRHKSNTAAATATTAIVNYSTTSANSNSTARAATTAATKFPLSPSGTFFSSYITTTIAWRSI